MLSVSVILNNKASIISGIYKSPKFNIDNFTDTLYILFHKYSKDKYLYLCGKF